MPETRHLCAIYLRMYWKTWFAIVYPFLLLPVFLVENTAAYRCLYVVLVMAGYWILDIFPLAVTGLIPMVLFPLMGVMSTENTSMHYIDESVMRWAGGLVLFRTMEYSGLHKRVAYNAMKHIGINFRRLSFALTTATMLISMWISNTATTAMMVPVLECIIQELDALGIGPAYHVDETISVSSLIHLESAREKSTDDRTLRPSKTTQCFFLGTAYAATIGGMGCIMGSGVNQQLRTVYTKRFLGSPPDMELAPWFKSNLLIMVLVNYLTWIYLQFWFMGLFRKKSADYERVQVMPEMAEAAREIVSEKLDALGRISFHEAQVALLFFFTIILWIFRQPTYMTGWAAALTDTQVADATVPWTVVILLFLLPAKPTFIYMFSSDETKRPTVRSPALVTWKFIQTKMSWGLIFLMGGGLAIAAASKKTEMYLLLFKNIEYMQSWPKYGIMCMLCLIVMGITQFTSNTAIVTMLLPVAAKMCLVAEIYPAYLLMPICLSGSASFCLPVSTPPNAIVSGAGHVSTSEMLKVGVVVQFIFYLVLISVFPLLAPAVWPGIHHYPKWAKESIDEPIF